MNYQPSIGIETHVQLATKSKLFCPCDNNAREAKPNTLVCPVCMGLPGTLPVLNHQAIQLALRVGMALNGQIAATTKFDRKNYFYPDLPKGYQISQFDQPIVGQGSVEFELAGQRVKVGITRAHLEEDAGKLTHPEGADYSLVDLNRAGTPLMEIVSEPDLHSAAEAKAYAQEIYNIVRYAKVSDADLYHGNMRFDVNVSLAAEGSQQLGTRTETKNLNSFRAVERAVAYEIKRQTELLEKGQKIIQETRGWDEAKGQTISQRSKEEAHDYRYFPEPDLPPIVVTKEMLAEAKQDLMTPNNARQELSKLGLADTRREVLVNSPEAVLGYLNDVSNQLFKSTEDQALVALTLEQDQKLREAYGSLNHNQKQHLAKLAEAVSKKTISATMFKQAINPVVLGGEDVGLYLKPQVSDQTQLEVIADQVIKANPQAVADYHAGQERAHKFLVGQVMKASAGQANPTMVNEILATKLKA
ncbi:MAG TPA: Asp-tRNA(Asn)/Glu-tRNA(Gln) amidotransferase subunit GatB [Candidatus Saccharimonadales bacterium]|nr:Asp-tRNA(Asn)/Glu-tRNA(Gln) amidotransferase subunit GatB [Candidatus Saccharimonadales bacterium]